MSCCDNEPKNNPEQSTLARMVSGPRRLWLIAAVVVGAGLVFGWEQLVIFGIAPILISLLPCLIMCGLGVCMMCRNKKSDGKAGQADEAEAVMPAKPAATASVKSSSSVEF